MDATIRSPRPEDAAALAALAVQFGYAVSPAEALDRLVRLGRAGLARVRVRSRVERADAHRFYRRLGYREVKAQAVLDRSLGLS
jgi:hypothetical protein